MIVIDDREVTQHPTIPKLLDLPDIKIVRLDAADYSFLNSRDEPVGIERSEIGNLLQKLRSGELESQMGKCSEAYSSIILLVEGVYDEVQGFLAIHRQSERGYFRNHIYPHTRYDYTMASIIRLSEMGIEVIPSPNFECSMVVVRTIYQQRTKPEDQHSMFKRIRPIRIPVKLSANPAVPRLMSLCPRLPEKTAIRLINKYESIWSILSTPDSELLGVEGMGKGLLDKLKRGVGKDV